MNGRALILVLLLTALAACTDAPTPAPQRVEDDPAEIHAIGTEVGDIAPGFTLPTPNGDSISLRSYRGKAVLVDFWGTWCAPCRAALPGLKETWERYRSRGFVILSVAVAQNPDDWRTVIAEEKLDWSHVIDGNQIAVTRYEVIGVPSTFLLDSTGRIVARNLSGSSLEQEIEKLVE